MLKSMVKFVLKFIQSKKLKQSGLTFVKKIPPINMIKSSKTAPSILKKEITVTSAPITSHTTKTNKIRNIWLRLNLKKHLPVKIYCPHIIRCLAHFQQFQIFTKKLIHSINKLSTKPQTSILTFFNWNLKDSPHKFLKSHKLKLSKTRKYSLF